MVSGRSGSRGATLLELLIAIFMGMILLMLVTRFFRSQNQTYYAQIVSSEMRQNVRAGIDLLSRELRMAGYDPMDVGFPGVAYDTSRIKIIADYDGDGKLTGPNEQLQYYLDEETGWLVRETGEFYGKKVNTPVVEPVMEEVKSFRFTFRDGDGATIDSAADSTEMRQIEISIELLSTSRHGAQAKADGRQTQAMTTLVVPRNLAY